MDTNTLFEGTYDDPTLRVRTIWRNGSLVAHAERKCIESNHRNRNLRKPFGTYPPLPYELRVKFIAYQQQAA